jgi:drug/metabolite transporter, DME family
VPRLHLVMASCLWSLSGGLAKIIALPGPSMAAYRALFAGLFLSAFVRREHIRWRPALVGMVLCFAALNLCFVWALTLTTSANAIFLQCTAPVWTLLICVFWLGEPPIGEVSFPW